MNWDAILSMRTLVLVTGALHFCQLPAMMIAPRVLQWGDDLAKLEPINRQIVKVIGGGIMLAGLGLGVVVVCAPAEVAGGSRLGMALACFLAVLWAYRAIVQIVVYRRIWPGGGIGRLSHYGLCLLFSFQTVAYAAAFVHGLMG